MAKVDGGFNVFVRIGAVARAGFLDLKEGQMVNFDIVVDEASGKLFAENLTIQVSESATLDASLQRNGATGFFRHYSWGTIRSGACVSLGSYGKRAAVGRSALRLVRR
jgi:CspA family cold shock protein